MASGLKMSPAKVPTQFSSTAPSPNLDLTNCNDKGSTESTATSKKTPSNNKAVSGRRGFGENGFEEGGGYMAVKRAKLDNQFNASTRGFYSNDDSEDVSIIFKGISIYINGYTDPPEPVLREKFIRNGGTFHPYNNAKTTYVVATNLAAPTKQRYGSKTITPDWIMDSISAGRALDTRKYMLYNFNQEKNQMTLTQIMTSKRHDEKAPESTEMSSCSKRNGKDVNVNASKYPEENSIHNDDAKERVSDSEEEFFECSQEMLPSSVLGSSVISTSQKINGVIRSDCGKNEKHSNNDISNSEEFASGSTFNGSVSGSSCLQKTSEQPLRSNNVNQDHEQKSPSKTDRIKTATDDGFLEDFFRRSRLHLISEQKKDMQILVGNLRKNIESHKFPNLRNFESEVGNRDGLCELSFASDEVFLMHVDLDCFFVSVGLLSRPHLRGKPVVVTHSSGNNQESKSDIACASYEARKFGVRNGMWVGQAKVLCPNLEVIPYDFEEYRRISKLFFETVASVTLDIEACSVDEMIVDATPVLRKVPGSTPESLAAFLRRTIWAVTNCPASIGIGSNRLLARLAVKLAKPDGIHHLKDEDAPVYIQSLQVRDLPGVGWSNEEKLRELNVDTCGDLLKIPFKELKTILGEKTAEKMLSLCKGIDTAEIKVGFERPKSVSVDANFGIRFTKEDEVTQFLMKICKELSNRAERIQAVSTHFTLKLLIRRKGAGEPLKQGGHGIVDSMTRSRILLNPTRNWNEFFKTASSLVRLMRVPPCEYRGVGVTLTDLTFDCDKSSKKSIQRTLTDMPISRAQKMLSISISQKRNKAPSTETSTSNKSDSDSPTLTPEEPTSSGQSVEIIEDNKATGDPNKMAAVTACTNGTTQNSTTVSGVEMQNQATTTDLSKLPIDVAVLRQLPREIAEEQCQFYGISKDVLDECVDVSVPPKTISDIQEGELANENIPVVASFYDNVETVDQSFLLALPENVRQDVLIQLQEAKSRRKVNDTSAEYDDQQPCSSRQALERNKKIEMQKTADNKNMDSERFKDSNLPMPLEEQTTPIISYSSNKSGCTKIEPKKFWDMSVDYLAVPSKPCNRPALNNCAEVGEVRDLIRQGLQVVSNPMPEEVENLEKYFIQLISAGWIEQTQVLLKFLYRQTIQLGEDSKWTSHLHKIIEKTQECCVNLYQGELEVE